MKIPIIYEDKDVIVCNKPVGMLVQSNKTLDADMVNELKNYIYEQGNCKSEPYIGLIQRLDRPVGGVLVFAKNPAAAKSLSEQVQDKRMKKKYYAVVTADLSEHIGSEKVQVVNYLIKNQRTNLSCIVSSSQKDAKRAELWYQVLSVAKDEEGNVISLLDVDLMTGRHHQIRVQLAGAGLALWGDTKYNTRYQTKEGVMSQDRWLNIGLFSHEINFYQPKTKKELKFKVLPEEGVFKRFSSYFLSK